MKKTKHISLPYTYYPGKSPQIQQHLIYNVNYFQPSHNNDERCQTDMNNNERIQQQQQQQHMKVQSFQAYNQNVVVNKHLCKYKVNKNERQHSHINSRNVHVMKNGNYNTTTTTSFSKEDEIKIMDIKLRCDIIQSRLRKLNCLSLTQNDDRLNRVSGGGGGVSKDKERCVVTYKEQRRCSNKGNNGNVSYEEENLSDIADDIVETFDLEQRFDNNNNNVSRSARSNNVNVYNKNMNRYDKEMKIRNTEKAIKDVVLIKEQPVNNVFEIHACRNVQGMQQVQQVNVVNNNNNNSDVSEVHHYHKTQQPAKSKANCEFQIQHQESASFIVKIQTPPPVEITDNQRSIIIHELSFQTSEHNNNNNSNNINVIEHNQHQILNQHNEISMTTTTLLTSLSNEHQIQNSNQSHLHLSETDDDKIISQILETAKLQALDNTNNTTTINTTNNINNINTTNTINTINIPNNNNNTQLPYHEQLHQVKSTESYKPLTPPKEFVSSIKHPSKKVTFNYEQTITIQYNDNDLITHLNVYNIDYNQLKHKPRIIKNYKTISNIGLKPCISPEYTKHLKLPHTKVQRLSNTLQQHNMTMNSINSSNSSRGSSLRKAVNLKRDSINSNNNNKEKNKKYKHKISIVKRKENKICKCQIKQQKQEEHLQQIQKKKVKDNSFDIVTNNNKTTKQKKQYINMDIEDHNRENSV